MQCQCPQWVSRAGSTQVHVYMELAVINTGKSMELAGTNTGTSMDLAGINTGTSMDLAGINTGTSSSGSAGQDRHRCMSSSGSAGQDEYRHIHGVGRNQYRYMSSSGSSGQNQYRHIYPTVGQRTASGRARKRSVGSWQSKKCWGNVPDCLGEGGWGWGKFIDTSKCFTVRKQ